MGNDANLKALRMGAKAGLNSTSYTFLQNRQIGLNSFNMKKNNIEKP